METIDEIKVPENGWHYCIMTGKGKVLYFGLLDDTYKRWLANTIEKQYFIEEYPNDNYDDYILKGYNRGTSICLMSIIEAR